MPGGGVTKAQHSTVGIVGLRSCVGCWLQVPLQVPGLLHAWTRLPKPAEPAGDSTSLPPTQTPRASQPATRGHQASLHSTSLLPSLPAYQAIEPPTATKRLINSIAFCPLTPRAPSQPATRGHQGSALPALTPRTPSHRATRGHQACKAAPQICHTLSQRATRGLERSALRSAIRSAHISQQPSLPACQANGPSAAMPAP